MAQRQRYEWTKNYTNGDTYRGEAVGDNIKDGQGEYFWKATGATYNGAWSDDLPHGQGTMTIPSSNGYTYTGSFACSARNGQGECRFNNGRVYTGEWSHDQMNGRGTLYGGAADNFVEYQGMFLNGERSGPDGRCTYRNGDTYVGEWLEDKRHGMGVWTLAQGGKATSRSDITASSNDFNVATVPGSFGCFIRTAALPSSGIVQCYTGRFHQDVPFCIKDGTLTYTDGSTYVGGIDAHLQREGEGQLRMANGDVYTGLFHLDAMEGLGVLQCAADGSSYEGMWQRGQMDGAIIYRRPRPNKLSPPLPHSATNSGSAPDLALNTFHNVVEYRGPCLHGEFTGSSAAIIYADHSTYYGEVRNGEPSGHGVLKNRVLRGRFPCFAFGPDILLLQYKGGFLAGELHGAGVATLRINPAVCDISNTASDDGGGGDAGGCCNSSGDSITQQQACGRFSAVLPEARGLQILYSRTGTFDGEWSHGLPEGVGQWQWKDDGDMYRGEVHLGLPHGQGLYRNTQEKYEGQFVNGQPSGQGIYRNLVSQVQYEGGWKAGLYSGKGKLVLQPRESSGGAAALLSCEGAWREGKMHGYCIEVTEVDTYEGDFEEGVRHGRGVLRHCPDDRYCYEGGFSRGCPKGPEGKLRLPSGTEIEGAFEDGVPHGEGIRASFPQGLRFKGMYDHGHPTGTGEIHYANGDHYSGEIEPAALGTAAAPNAQVPQRHGQGMFVFAEGSRLACTWKHNILHGPGTYTAVTGEVSERHYVDGVVATKIAAGRNVFTPENEFPNAQSEAVLKGRVPNACRPVHKVVRRQEDMPNEVGNLAAPTGASHLAPATTNRNEGAKIEARAQGSQSITTKKKGMCNQGSFQNGRTAAAAALLGNPNLVSLPTFPSKRSRAPSALRDKAIKSGSTRARPIFEKLVKSFPLHTTSEEGNGNGNVVGSHFQSLPPPQVAAGGPGCTPPAKYFSAVESFQEGIKRLSDANENVEAMTPTAEEGEGGLADATMAFQCRGLGKQLPKDSDIFDPGLPPHARVMAPRSSSDALAVMMREACAIRSSSEDEIHLLTEEVRVLNEKIWQLRFSITTATVPAKKSDVGGSSNGNSDKNDEHLQHLKAMMRERQGIVEKLQWLLKSVSEE